MSKVNRFSYIILQCPGAAQRAGEPAVSSVIVDEAFGFRVPLYFLFEPYGNVSDMANYICLHSDINGTYRIVPGLDTIQQVSYVVAALVQVNVVCPEFRIQQIFRISVNSGAVNMYPSICALEGCTV